jgi:hypothetical protein
VVKAAITMMKIGIRTDDGINFLNAEITISDAVSTNVIASPIPSPFATLDVTASAEQSPIISIRSGFSFINPFLNI